MSFKLSTIMNYLHHVICLTNGYFFLKKKYSYKCKHDKIIILIYYSKIWDFLHKSARVMVGLQDIILKTKS